MAETLSPVRVCFFSYYFPPHFSGAALSKVSLAKALARHGVEASFLTVDNNGLPRDDTYEGFRVHRIGGGLGRHGEFRLWWNMWRALRARRRDFDILHAAGCTYRDSAVGPIARLLGKRSLAAVSLANDDLAFVGRTAAGRLQALMLRWVDRYVSISAQLTEELRRLPLDFGRVVELPVGVDTERFSPAGAAEKAALRVRAGLPDGPLALYAGVLDRRKNVEWLVRSWIANRSSFRGWRLLLVGPASRHPAERHLATTLPDLVQAHGLADEILFRNFTPRIEDCLRAADLLILPSKNEGMPNVVLEAMACGLPCAATRISGTPDLIEHGRTGVLFTVDDDRDFLQATQPLVDSPALRAEVGRAARARIVAQFSTRVTAERYARLYREMLERP